MSEVDPIALGRAFMEELRDPVIESPHRARPATDLLRWDGDKLADETVWRAVLTAVELALDESERWLLADGVVDEQIATRPALRERWRGERDRNPAVQAVYEAMWADLDSCGLDRGWWGE